MVTGIVKIYLDGTLIHTDDVETPNTSLNNGKIGSYIDDSQKWNGAINEVAVWNSALDHDEIIALYNSGIDFDHLINSGNYNSASNIKAYWKFNAGDEYRYDHSGNQNHGSINGADWTPIQLEYSGPKWYVSHQDQMITMGVKATHLQLYKKVLMKRAMEIQY